MTGFDEFFPAAAQHPSRLRRQADELFNTGPSFRDGHFFQQRAELHDEGNFTGGKIFADDNCRY